MLGIYSHTLILSHNHDDLPELLILPDVQTDTCVSLNTHFHSTDRAGNQTLCLKTIQTIWNLSCKRGISGKAGVALNIILLGQEGETMLSSTSSRRELQIH